MKYIYTDDNWNWSDESDAVALVEELKLTAADIVALDSMSVGARYLTANFVIIKRID